MARYSGLRFVGLLGSGHSNQAICTLARELPNFAVAGYWWHNFYPSIMQGILEQRLDMLPMPRHIGFFSDAYTVEWVYAKALMVRRIAERVLGGRVREGWYTFEDAVAIARAMWQQTPADFLRMKVGGQKQPMLVRRCRSRLSRRPRRTGRRRSCCPACGGSASSTTSFSSKAPRRRAA